MRTIAGLVALATIASLVGGCGKKSDPPPRQLTSTETQNQTTNEAGTDSGPTSVVYRPPPLEANSAPLPPGKPEAAYEAAAKVFWTLKDAANYERAKIAAEGMRTLSEALSLSAERLQSNPNAPNLLRMVQIDSRFAYATFIPKYREFLTSAERGAGLPPFAEVTVTNKDLASLGSASAPESQSPAAHEPGVKAPRPTGLRPDKVLAGAEKIGTIVVGTARELQAEEQLNRKLAQLIEQALQAKNWEPILALAPTDEPKIRAAKLALADAFPGLLASITFYKGSYFQGQQSSIGQIYITQFRQPISIFVFLAEAIEKDRMNTGIEWTGKCVFGPDPHGPENLFRTYAGGWWGTWAKLLALQQIDIQKAGDWVLTHYGRCRYFRLTAQEIELALSRDDTTRTFAKFPETHRQDDDPKNIREHADALALRGQDYLAHEVANSLLYREDLDLSTAKWLTSFFGNHFPFDPEGGPPDNNSAHRKRPPVQSHPGQVIEENPPEPPPRPKSENPDLEHLILAYQALVKADPEDPDAQLDLALLALYQGIAPSDIVLHAVVAVKMRHPTSGRDFKYIIANTPTFARCYDHRSFLSALGKLGKKPDDYRAQFPLEIPESPNY
jgi:hypothetical protein